MRLGAAERKPEPGQGSGEASRDGLFWVAAAEGLIATAEDAVIRQIAAELGLTHQDFIAIRSRYRDHLAVLQEGAPRQG